MRHPEVESFFKLLPFADTVDEVRSVGAPGFLFGIYFLCRCLSEDGE